MSRPASPALALVVADGDVPPLGRFAGRLGASTDDALVICADGGLRKAELLGLRPTVVIGDGDSLDADTLAVLGERGVEVRVHPPEKDESDTQLALLEAARRGARRIIVLGALGGLRFDHALANVLLLALPELAGRDVALLDGTTTVRLLSAGSRRLEVTGRAGDLVSLLPLTARVNGVRTDGLRYPLQGETLSQGPARGLSNELTGERASIDIADGRLAVIHTTLDNRQGGTS